MLTEIAEKLAAAPQEPPSPAVAEDLKSFLDQQGDEVSKQLTVANEMMGLDHFSSRVLPFVREVRSRRAVWQARAPDYAAPSTLTGQVEHLRSLMERAHERTQAKVSLCAWVHATRTPSGHVPCVLLRHSTGYEQLYLVKGSSWIPIPTDGPGVEVVARALLEHTGAEKRYWKDVYGALLTALLDFDEERDAAVQKALGLEKPLDMSTRQSLLKALFDVQEVFQVLLEIARSSACGPLREAHALLVAATELADAATKAIQQTEERLKREHARNLKVAQSNVDKLRSAAKLTDKKVAKLEADLAEARGKLKEVGQVRLPASGRNASAPQGPCAPLEAYFS